jgi:membrane protein required for beta-lactamase induction
VPPPPASPYTAAFPAHPAAASTAGVADDAAAARTMAFRRGAPAKSKAAAVQPRRANLVVARLEPWSVMKFSFLMSLVAWLVLFVAVALLYYALSGLGVFAALQRTLTSVTSSQGSTGVDLSKWTSASRVLGYTMLIGAVNVVLITALSTIGAMIYNLVTHLGGGIEVTLKETD